MKQLLLYFHCQRRGCWKVLGVQRGFGVLLPYEPRKAKHTARCFLGGHQLCSSTRPRSARGWVLPCRKDGFLQPARHLSFWVCKSPCFCYLKVDCGHFSLHKELCLNSWHKSSCRKLTMNWEVLHPESTLHCFVKWGTSYVFDIIKPLPVLRWC